MKKIEEVADAIYSRFEHKSLSVSMQVEFDFPPDPEDRRHYMLGAIAGIAETLNYLVHHGYIIATKIDPPKHNDARDAI